MGSVTVGFSIPADDIDRLDRLVERYGGGNRSAFLRYAMRLVEAQEIAEDLRDLQRYGNQRAAEQGIDPAGVDEIVRGALKGR